jgi:apolipoprotein N-acyltransferase
LLAASFPKIGGGLLVLVALVPLLIALEARTSTGSRLTVGAGFRLGYLTGAVYFLTLLYWIPSLPSENVTVPFLMVPALLAAVAYLALYPGLSAMIAVLLARRGVPVAFALPPIWVFAEYTLGQGTFGFPWGSLGYAPAAFPVFIQFAAYTGLWGVSLWIVLVNGLVAEAFTAGSSRRRMVMAGLATFFVLAPALQGAIRLRRAVPLPTVTVGLVQPNVGEDKWRASVRDSVVAAVLETTRNLAASRVGDPPDLYVWPETAVPAPIRRDPLYRKQVKDLVEGLKVPLLAGFPDIVRQANGDARYTNSAALLLPGQGLVHQYDKRHLVPFSEYFPLPLLNRLNFGQSDFTPGEERGLFTQLPVPFGVLICFESIFPEEARALCRGGARYLVNITNDEWFGDSAAPYQHFEMNVLRCIENGTGMARAANTGISAILDPYGRVVAHTPTFIKTGLFGQVQIREATTFYTRFGDWVLGLCGLWVLFLRIRYGRRRVEE